MDAEELRRKIHHVERPFETWHEGKRAIDLMRMREHSAEMLKTYFTMCRLLRAELARKDLIAP